MSELYGWSLKLVLNVMAVAVFKVAHINMVTYLQRSVNII